MPIKNRKLEPGTRLTARYKRQPYEATVIETADGIRYRLEDGREFASPSAAGSAVMGGTACNGWRFWSVAGEATDTDPQEDSGRDSHQERGAERRDRGKDRRRAGASAQPPSDPPAPEQGQIACGGCDATLASTDEATAHFEGAHPETTATKEEATGAAIDA